MDRTDRLRKRARVLSAVVTALWAAVAAGFVCLTVALQYADPAEDDRGAAVAQFASGFAALVALGPTLLWLVATLAYRRGRPWAAAVAVAVSSATGMCSMVVLGFSVFADWGGYLTVFVLLLNGLGVAAVMAMVAARAPLATPSAPRSG